MAAGHGRTTMIDSATETMLTLGQAARETPNRQGRRGIDARTIWRWAKRGIHGVLLETLRIGGVRYTSREALQRFFAASTAAADRTAIPARTPRQRAREVAAATDTLVRDGA